MGSCLPSRDGYTSPDQDDLKLSVWTGVVFIAGEIAGSGLLALPRAVEDTGWIGIVLLPLCCVANGWCGILLGRCWLILEERFPEYKEQCRNPYPAIGFEVFGKPGRFLVSACINVTLFGVAVVFMILAATNLNDIFVKVPLLHFSPCFYMIIITVIEIPVVWLGTPKDFWPIAVAATVTTGIASLLLIPSMVLYPRTGVQYVEHIPLDVERCALGFGIILFAFGGAPAFPTIQHDMQVTSDFNKAVILGFLALLMMYFPVAVVGYTFLGDTLSANILDTLEGYPTWMYYIIQICMCTHLFSAFTIVLNPLCQAIEHQLDIPQNFTWKRAVCRTTCVLLVLLVSELMPHFAPILSLVGGSTNTLLCIIFPCVFYWKLCSFKDGKWPDRKIALYEKVLCIIMIGVGGFGGAVTIYAAIEDLAKPESFIPPCFVNTTIN